MIPRVVLVAVVTMFVSSAAAQPPGMTAPKVDVDKIASEYPVIELVTMASAPDLGAPRPHRAVRTLRESTCRQLLQLRHRQLPGAAPDGVGVLSRDQQLLGRQGAASRHARDLSVGGSDDLGPAAAARRGAEAAGPRQARARYPRGEQVLLVRSLLRQLHDARSRHHRQRDRRPDQGDDRQGRSRPHVPRSGARRLLRDEDSAAHHRLRDGPDHGSRADLLGAHVPAAVPARSRPRAVGHRADRRVPAPRAPRRGRGRGRSCAACRRRSRRADDRPVRKPSSCSRGFSRCRPGCSRRSAG